MSISRVNIVLGVLLVVLVAALIAATGDDRSKPNVEFLPDMKRSPAYSAYAPNPDLPNNRTLQTPVTGTIARGEMLMRYAPTPADAVRAGEELVNPFAEEGDERLASIRRGGNVYRVFCTPCHGGGGRGDGLVVRKGYPAPTESLVTGKSTKMQDGQLFHIVTYGKYPEATPEPPRYPRMPSFAPQLTPPQRWDVINYIRSLQAANPVDSPVPADTEGESSVADAPEAEQADSTEEPAADSDTPSDLGSTSVSQ